MTSSPDTLPPSWQRLLALSGVAFALLLLFGWFLSGGNTPDYAATDEAWTTWAADNRLGSRIGAFLMLLAGFALLHFAGTIRAVLGGAESTVGSGQLAQVAFGGAVVGAASLAMAIVMVGAATSEGADADPVVSRAVAGAATAGPYLVAAMGFAALLGSAGLLTLRTGVFSRWTGIVALIGAIAFLITFLTLIAGTGKDSVFGYFFLPGILALVLWSIATSIACYRAVRR